jgi:hypothetical protein
MAAYFTHSQAIYLLLEGSGRGWEYHAAQDVFFTLKQLMVFCESHTRIRKWDKC